MRKIALVSSFCDTQEKLSLLKDNLIKLKSLGLDLLVISPLPLPTEIIEISDYTFFTKENPVLSWPERSFTFWKTVHTSDGWIMIHYNLSDYGWAGLYQVKKLSQIALSYDYDLFYHLIYDLEIDETVINEIQTNQKNILHPRINPKNPDEFWEATLHFMIFDRKTMEDVVSRIDLKTYLDSNGVAEGQALKWAKEIPLKISDIPVKDKIYFWEDKDFFDYNGSKDFKFFLSKNDDTTIWIGEPPIESNLNSDLRILFYDVVSDKKIKIIVNQNEYELDLKENVLFNSRIDSAKVKSLKILFDGKSMDLTETYRGINRNLIYYK